MHIEIQPVILCGGSGSRLWPLSRSGFPKQFLSITGAETLFQQAATRLGGSPYVVCNEEHRFLAHEQLREVGIENPTFLLEPEGRNTAPALTLAALAALERGNDPVLVVIPADQNIGNEAGFKAAMSQAVDKAAQGGVVILGVAPTRPETGYGYIQVDANCQTNEKAQSVLRFVEKPDTKTAQHYLDEGGYYWNAGMFVVKASVWLGALEKFRPDVARATCEAWKGKSQDRPFVRPDKDLFIKIPSESVDYAVIEKCPGSCLGIHMVPLDAGWSDLGAWDAVWEALPKNDQLNVHHGDVLSIDTSNTLVHASGRLVALVGVKNIVVVETADAVLVVDKSRCQDVKKIVGALGEEKREEHVLHRKVHRPWGWYDSVDEGGRFKVKRIKVKPKASLSLQKHYHRAEHWIVVKGTAEITNGEKTLLLTENQSTYIPLGEIHRLANPGSTPLEIIEVQSGAYLGEDDIVRFDDNYGRSK